jgi:hypothetical protein
MSVIVDPMPVIASAAKQSLLYATVPNPEIATSISPGDTRFPANSEFNVLDNGDESSVFTIVNG